jgi:hypothetical protein
MRKLVSITAAAIWGALAFAGVAAAEPPAAPAGAKPAAAPAAPAAAPGAPAAASPKPPQSPAEKAKAAAEAAAMEKWMKLATPGEAHQMLAKTAGKWNATTKMVMMPGAPAQESAGTAEFTPVLDGRFIRQDFTGNFMGQTFHGIGYTGYDNFRKEYIGSWMDSMGTAMMVSTGTADKDGKTVTYTSTMDDPMTGEKNKKTKQVFRWVDDKTFVWEMYDRAKGKEWKALEITYTRAP